MSDSQFKPDVESGLHIFTQHPVEKFTFTWQITNFSKIMNTVRVQFKTFSGATTWKLSLSVSGIELLSCFDGGSLEVHFTCNLFTDNKTITEKGHKVFDSINNSMIIMNAPWKNIYFENDIFNLQCKMNIIGHYFTTEMKSTGSDLKNIKQLSCDIKDFFEKQEHCDLTMIVGQDKIKVHKSILCARSPVFNRMFHYAILETDSKEIQINDIDFGVLKDFLAFLYSGELDELSWDKALQLYYAADKYEIISLRETCSNFLEFNLDVYKVCDVLKLTDMHRDEKLKESAICYAQAHLSALKSTDSWQELVITHPKLAVEIWK